MRMSDVDPDALGALLRDAVALTREAGELTLRWFRAPDLEVGHKGDRTPVTAADRAAEAFLRSRLAARFPDDGILGEEAGEEPGTSGLRWVIDPIDGTKAFTAGVPLYSTLLALVDDRGERPETLLGVVHLPALGSCVYAASGLGCWMDGRPAHVRPRPDLEGAWVLTSGIETWTPAMLDRVQSAGAQIRTWGDAYGYTLVATGWADAMVDPVVSLWDVAPMPVILHEAGGRFTSLSGRADVAEGTALGTCGPLHDELLALLAS